MATTFSHQNDTGSRTSTSQYWENLLFVVELVLESKALCYIITHLCICENKVLNVDLPIIQF